MKTYLFTGHYAVLVHVAWHDIITHINNCQLHSENRKSTT